MSAMGLTDREYTALKDFLKQDIQHVKGLVETAKANNVAKASETKEALRDLKMDIKEEIRERDKQIADMRNFVGSGFEALRIDLAVFKKGVLTVDELKKSNIKMILASIPPYFGLIISIVLLIMIVTK
jgi:hypothetical protein